MKQKEQALVSEAVCLRRYRCPGESPQDLRNTTTDRGNQQDIAPTKHYK